MKIHHPPADGINQIWDLEWQDWPETWSRLSALTSLSCSLHPHASPHVPAVLNCMTSLRKLVISHHDPTEDEVCSDEDSDSDLEGYHDAITPPKC